jgi:hypothetical protein
MRKKLTNKFGAYLIFESTQSYKSFSDELTNLEMLMLFLLANAKHLSTNVVETKKLIANIFSEADNEAAEKTVEFMNSNHSDKYLDIFYYEKHFSGMTYVKSIDNFITYFKDILAEIVLMKPQILKSKENEKLDFILSFESMDDLIKAISEKKIEELFYKGITDIEKFFDDRLGVKIFKDEKTKNDINLLIKQRNLAVHNRGKISKEFVKDFPNNNFIANHFLDFNSSYVSDINGYLNNFIIDLEIELSEKFQLELIKI